MDNTTQKSTRPHDKLGLRKEYLEDILGARRMDALGRVMAAYRSGYAIPDIYIDVFQASLYELGRLWESNRISVADEHMGTAITQFIMSNLYQHLEISEVVRGRLVVTGVQGELHQVGANMIADVLEADGWDVRFLGANVPPEDVIRAVREHEADLLGISATMYVNLPEVVQLVGMVRQEFGGKSPRILLGGGAFGGLPLLPPKLEGCLVVRDLKEAVFLTRTFGQGDGPSLQGGEA